MTHLLLFGANGTIGKAIGAYAAAQGFKVTGAARKAIAPASGLTYTIIYDASQGEKEAKALKAHAPYDAVCWAQGANAADSVYDVDAQAHLKLYEANCLFVLTSLQQLLTHKLLAKPSRLVVLSSIWQQIARQNKLSYTMTKAALEGFVHSASVDLAEDGHLINAVLPGVLDTPMTRANLSPEQLSGVETATLFKKLAKPEDVASLVCYLCSGQNQSITGQSIPVDLGFSHARRI